MEFIVKVEYADGRYTATISDAFTGQTFLTTTGTNRQRFIDGLATTVYNTVAIEVQPQAFGKRNPRHLSAVKIGIHDVLIDGIGVLTKSEAMAIVKRLNDADWITAGAA